MSTSSATPFRLESLPDPAAVSDLDTARSHLFELKSLVTTLVGVTNTLGQNLQQLNDQLAALLAENAELKRRLFGKRSEKMPPISREVQKRRAAQMGAESSPEEKAEQQRRKRPPEEVAREQNIPIVEVVHSIPPEAQVCPRCQSTDLRALGSGEVSYSWEHIPEQIVLHKHIRQKASCRCGGGVVTAKPPQRVGEQSMYGPGMHAAVVVSKCAESMPLYRQSQRFARAGILIPRSTLCTLFHRSAEVLRPLYQRAKEIQKTQPYLNADETPQPVWNEDKVRKGFMWTFVSEVGLLYVFSAKRSGAVPEELLGASQGTIQVDGHTGYNKVCTPNGRKRVGCLAHVRRKFFDALPTAPEQARWVLDRITDLYLVEAHARDLGIIGTEEHRALRQLESKPIVEALDKWVRSQKGQPPPKSPLAKALAYAENQWSTLLHFLDDPKLYLDNNTSERALRIIAKGRDNFLWVGHDEAGENLAILQTFVATCQLHDVNPYEWLKDVLIRISTHPNDRIEELLPHRWKEVFAKPPPTEVPVANP